MKKLTQLRTLFLAVLILSGFTASAQLTGTKNIPGDYATLALAVQDLNTQGVGAGGVNFNLVAGNPQTAPAGGYIITATGTAANTITFIGNANTITASPALTAGALGDGIFMIMGGDFITIAQFSMQENAANTTTAAATNNMTEFGVGLFYGSVTDGAQNNTITANTIALNRTYSNTFGVYSTTRHTPAAPTVAADITAASGANSNNKVWANNISNVNQGITFIGSTTAANMDSGNDIGGASSLTGNVLTNWGGITGATTSFISNSGNVYGIFLNHQVGSNVSYNTLTNASAVNTTTLRGIYEAFATTNPTATATNSITNNTVTLASASTSSGIIAIEAANGASTLTRAITNNSIIGCSNAGASSSSTMICILNSGVAGSLTMAANIIRNNTSTATGAFTGISNTGAVVNSITIAANQIGNSTGGAVTYTANAGATGITNTGAAATAVINITGNTLQGFALVSGTFTGVTNTGGGITINISGNLIGTSTAGAVSYSAASSGAVRGIQNTAGAAGSTVSITGNDIRGIVHSVAGSSTHTYIANSSANANSNINGNTFTNLNVNTTGSVTFIDNNATHAANTTHNVNGNSIVTAYNKAGAGGTILFYNSFSTSLTAVTEINNANNFSNMTFTGAVTITGWRCGDGSTSSPFGPNKTVTNNTFSNITGGTNSIQILEVDYSNSAATANNVSGNIISNVTGAGAIIGIVSAAGSQVFASNTISGLSSTGASTVSAISITGGAVQTLSKNKIYDIQANNAAGVVNGIVISASTTANVSNNYIGDLRTPASSAANPLNGINITGGTNINVYYNTIRLNATSTGTNFGSTGISVSTSPTVELRNNLVVNISTAAGTGLTVAYRRSTTTLTTYAAASNTNSFYAGVPSATNLIFTDGTNNDQTIGAFKTRVASRDAGSLSENPTFISTSGASAQFLHIAAATVTLLESGGTAVSGVTTDYDNDVRPGPAASVNGGGTAPDIGADEFDGTPVLCNGTPTAGTVSGAPASRCGPGTFTLSSTGLSFGPGIIYQWRQSATSGGPYTNVAGGTTVPFVTGTISTTTYYVLDVTCTGSGQTVTSTEIAAVVFPLPNVAVTPTSSSICLPGGSPVVLTATGAATYAWSPNTTLTPTTGSPVTASPTVTTTYTVTGTDANGCTGTATATVTVSSNPVVTVTATPSSVCFGGSSQLLATATSSLYTLTTIPHSIITPVSPTTITNAQWINTGNDDGSTAALTLPFSFNFYGNSYTQYYLGTNGYLSFNNLAAETGAALRTPQAFPSTATPNNLIAISMSDLHMTGTAVVRTFVSGVAPNRVFVVDYTAVPFYDGISGTGGITAQIQLYETTNVVEIHVTSLTHGTSTAAQTLGIENSTGTVGSTPAGRSNTLWNVSTPEAYRWTPGPYTYSWTPSTFLNNSTIANPLASNITATTSYTATVTTGAGCSATGSVTIVTGTALSNAASVSPAASVCAGTNVTLNSAPAGGGAPYTYMWTGPNAFTSTLQNPTINNVTVANSGVYSVTATDACGATSTSTVSLTVNGLPVVVVTPSSATYCNPGPGVSLTASGATTYAWGPAAGLSATTGSNVIATPTVSTTYTVTGTNANGCTSTASATITSAPGVTGAVATATPSVICVGGSADLASSASPYTSTLLSENFNAGAPAWVRGNTSTGGTPANAAWTDRPDAFVYAFGTPYHSNDNTQFVQTNSDAQGSGSTTRTTLTSPAFNTTGLVNVNVNFYQYYRDINDNGDSAVVEASVDNINWTIVTAYTATSGVENAFSNQNVVLPAGFNNQPAVYVRFRFIATWDWYWSIDNVTITAGASNYTYSWTSTPVGFTSTAQNPTGVMPTATTAYNVTLTNPFGCTGTASTTITVNPLPTVTASATPATVCAGSPSTLTGGGATTYTWTPGPLSGPSVTVNPTVTTVYTVTGTNGNGCSNTATVSVTVNPSPVVALGADITQCAGTVVLDAQNPGSTYMWSNNTTSQTLTVSASGTYSVVVTNANGCSSSDEIVVTINPLPVVALGADVVQCGGSVLLDAQNAGATFMWSDNSTNQTLNVTSTGTYSVVVTNANGCSASDAINVDINPIPVVALGIDITQCGGSTVLDAQNPGATYMWSDNSTSQTLTVTATGTYSVVVTNANGCSANDEITVTINPIPVVALGADITQCGGSVLLDAQNAGASFMWSDNSTNQTLNVTATGTYSVVVTDSTGCSASDMIDVTINPVPVVALGIDIAQCGGTAVLDAQNPGATYMWSDNSTSQTLTVIASGTYSVVVTNSDGCSANDEINVAINAIPVVALGADIVQCGGPVTLDAGVTPNGSYMWSDNSTNQTLVVNASGSYSVTVTNTATGCSNADSINVTINTVPTVVFTAADTVCDNGGMINLTASPAGGAFSGTGVTGSTFNPSVAGAGNTFITYTYTDPNGCIASVNEAVFVDDCSGITEQSVNGTISVYPNPNNGHFTITINQLNAEGVMQITDALGQVVSSETLVVNGSVTKEIDLGVYANGMYFVRFTTNATTSVQKVNVQR